jgi:uncharacterized membrane protein YhhN
MHRVALFAFIVVALLELWAEATAHNTLVYYTKPLLMPLLALWLLTTVQHSGRGPFFRRSVFAALVFSTLGDVLLMFQGAIFFLAGLFFFLLAHLFYIGAFTKISPVKSGFLRHWPGWTLPFLAYPALLLQHLWTDIPKGLHLPVLMYALVITAMAWCVVNMKGKIPDGIFWSMLAGALLFIASDSMIALYRFGHPFDGARVAIMLTYIAGQFLLVQGAVRILRHEV